MDMYLSDSPSPATHLDPNAVLVVADSDSARVRARHTIAMAGLRFVEADDIAAGCARVRGQPAASALWIELDGGAPPSLEALLDEVASRAGQGRFPALVAAPSSMLDGLSAHAFNSGVELLIDASDDERIAALALAVSGAFAPTRAGIAEASDKNAARLRQLSDEVSRIAATLARLSTGPTSPRPLEPPAAGDTPDVSVETIRTIIRARRLRSRYFPEDLFADPAWDMLLDLLQAEISRLRVPVSSLCIAAAVPATTALRWLKSMVQEEIFVRREDPHDGRRVFVELAPATSQALRRYFAEIGQVAVV